MNDKKQWMWYWMPVEGKQHYLKDVTLCFRSAKEGHTYQNIGICVMDNFGELVKVSL
jgi:hypothetical protein